jgi:hypothetical protein
MQRLGYAVLSGEIKKINRCVVSYIPHHDQKYQKVSSTPFVIILATVTFFVKEPFCS